MAAKVEKLRKGRLAAVLLLAAAVGLALGTWAVIVHKHHRNRRHDPPGESTDLAAVVRRLTLLAPPLRPPPACTQDATALVLSPESDRHQVRRIDYTREVKPILSEACFGCHGPDGKSRKAGLRLDTRAHAVKSAIVPGDASRSLLVQKVCSGDEAARMPPPACGKHALKAAQVEVLRQWIDQGALYQEHWAFVPPVRPAVPAVRNPAWVRNPIDAFIAAGHDKQGLSPAPQADRRTLLRRLCYDLTGLLPAPDAGEAFEQGPPEAYEEWVDRLLASPHFGERLAVLWLDLVRYADTDGYSVDAPRSVWLYRDWVINAFNRNLPFDQFTIRQLAGDLVPGSPPQDRIASGYNRLLMTSQEMCANEEERRAQYLADRVRNVSSAWLGLTLGCAECHDHKFDPLTARNFYRLGAFFADIQEKGVGVQETTLLLDPVRDALLLWHDTLIRRLEDRLLELPGVEQAAKELQARPAVTGEPGKEVPPAVLAALAVPGPERDPDQVRALLWYFQPDIPGLKPFLVALTLTHLSRQALFKDASPGTLTTVSGRRRVVRVLRRGNFRDRSGEVVGPGLPEVLSGGYALGENPTRLDLAKWLVASDNPLVARVFVNHLWRIAFGKGLVATPEDFGTRGSPPSHPELLDWLAVEFRESGWDVKALLRLLVTSSAYRQASLVCAEERQRDPRNLWLARQDSVRFEAEFLRDNALAAAGLLARRLGGPSVAPYQPDGFWIERPYLPSVGDEQHRRGLYTLWCRNYLHPALQLFDAPPRRVCCAERSRSATPLQSLGLLNDPSFTEAARALACRLLREAQPPERLGYAFRLTLAREPDSAERRVLEDLYERHLAEFCRDRDKAAALTSVGQAPSAPDVDVAEWAAWTSVVRVILNLHETVTRY
jgi:hypothetical protein